MTKTSPPAGKPSVEELKKAILAQRLKERMRSQEAASAASSKADAIAPVERSQPLPLSWAQQRLWFLDQLDSAAGAAYHLPAGLRLRGKLNRAALLQTLAQVVARHEGLRSRFVLIDGAPRQTFAAADIGFTLIETDLRQHPKRDAELNRIAEAEVLAPFDLAHGPLIRGQLLQLADDEHVLLITQHHIVSDGWSIGVLVREVTALYAAFSQSQPDPLPPLAIQYADYAVWQRQWLQGDALRGQLAFWQQHLRDAPALLELPTDHPRPATQRYIGSRELFTFAPDLTAGLRTLAQQQGCTLFMALLTGWAILLSRLSGQTDLVIGAPVANRQRGDVEGLIGFFVNTLALRLQLDPSTSVADLLRQVRDTTLAAYEHQDVPFEQVVEAIQPPRSLSYSPIFQVVLTLDNTPKGSGLRLGEVTLDDVELAHRTTHFDVTLALGDADGVLQGMLEYATDLFEPATIQRWQSHLVAILQAMVSQPQQAVRQIPWLNAAQTKQVLVDFNASTQAQQPFGLIHQRFEHHVAQQPQALALAFEEQQLSYAELNRRANQLAHYLRTLGIQPDDRVAICVDRGLEMVIGLLGILKAGGAYVPLDPTYPAERLAFMLADSSPVALLSQSAQRDVLPAWAGPLLLLDAAKDQLAAQPTTNPDPAAVGLATHHLAYVIYTSGSTGQPKGVLNEHRGLCNLAQAQTSLFGAGPGSRVLQFASFSFDASVWEIVMALGSGASLVLASREALRPGPPLQDLVLAQQISHITLPSSALAACNSDAWPPLTLVVAGEAFPPELARQWSARHRVINAYGPTETTVCATTYPCHTNLGHTTPIGSPLANTQVYILDADLQPLPIGVSGEIHIAGAGLARGYLNRPDLSAERFIANPFSADATARMYKTGDLGRWLADGSIEYLGRNDFQVKLRGFRIELGEIEARLAACPGVREAAVIAREDQPGDKRLVAYVTAQAGIALSIAELRSQLAAHLAEYMLPSAFVVLDALPLTSNGKLDRRALPAPDRAAVLTRSYAAPEGAIETTLAHIWQDLLGLAQVGRHDHFFELGGHSLLVVTLIEKLHQHALIADVRTVFSHPVLAELAANLKSGTSTSFVAPPNLIRPDTERITPDLLPLVQLSQAQIDAVVLSVPGGGKQVQDIYPLAPLQAGILFHHLLHTEGDAYLLRNLLHFDNEAALQRFIAASQTVLNRHDVLRSAIYWQGLEQAVQVVWRHADFPVHTVVIPPDCTDARSFMLSLSDPRHVRLNLQQAPLVAAMVARVPGEDTWLMALLNHHIASDHVTLERFNAEVALLLDDRAAELPTPVPYRNFVAQHLADSPQRHEDYFRQQLGDVEEPTAPFGLLDTQSDGSEIEEATLHLDDELTRQVRELARRQGVSAAVLFHVAWAQVLARCVGRADVVFGTVLSGRLQGGSGADKALGLFINTLPVRVRLAADAATLVKETYAQLSELLEHEQASLALAQRCSGLAPSMPLFTSLLNFRHSVDPHAAERADTGGDVFTRQGIRGLFAEERSNYPISINIDDLGHGLAINAQCPASIKAERLAGYLLAAISSLAAALQQGSVQKVSQLNILPPSERALLLHDFNATTQPATPLAFIHQPFEQQAALSPNARAIVCGGQSLSYGELNQRANQLAHHLIALGIGPDARVAQCVERSLDMLIGLFAILKAGAAYVPLDPAYPQQRIAYMLQDSAPAALLTQGHLLESLPSFHGPVLALDSDAAHWAQQPSSNPDPTSIGLQPQHLAYVIYTSGSTGQPKGACVTHAGLRNLLDWYQLDYGFNAADRVLLTSSFSFDLTQKNLFVALFSGGELHLAAPLFNPPEVIAQIAQHAITTLNLAPSVFYTLVDADQPGALASLRRVFLGGEPINVPRLRQLGQDYPQLSIINSYGPTECTDVVAAYTLPRDETSFSLISPPIGKPNRNNRIYLLDADLQPVPLGVAGEIHIAGTGVGRGYLHRPELTDERFVRDPFSDDPNARLYKTGDLGRRLADGNVDYLGRNDFQVKIRGFRIELGEIEAKLAACPNVREAVVIAREDQPGEKRLVAYLIATPDSTLNLAEVRQTLAGSLADYMLPNAYVCLAQLPLTPSGKLDRRALPAPDAAAVLSRDYEAPQSELETAIAEAWQRLLGVPQVGRQDHFFELGGHSLLAVQLVSRLRQTLGFEIPLRHLFSHPVLADFAAAAQTEAAHAHPNLVPIRTSGSRPPLFFIHPGGGECGYARDLAPWINAEIPVYGLSASGFLDGETPLDSVAAMATLYIEAISHVQTAGPFHLAGWSTGGTIAYEMAAQLLAAGHTVKLCGLIDTLSDYRIILDHTGENLHTCDVLLYWLSEHANANLFAELKTLARQKDLDVMLAFCRQHKLIPPEVDQITINRHLAVQRAMLTAMVHYHPTAIPSETHFFAAEDSTRTDTTLGWAAIMGDALKVVTIGGSHDTIVGPGNAHYLGGEISKVVLEELAQ